MHLVAIVEVGDEGHSGHKYVSGGYIFSQKVACRSRVEDGPSFDGSGIGCNGSQED
jgi:hypothetical protein